MNEIADQMEIAAGSITPELTPDQVAEVYVRIKAFQERADAVMEMTKKAIVAYIKETDTPITIGTLRLYIGAKREKKVRDRAECLQSLVEQFGPKHVGEQFLSSNAFKHGAISKEVDEAEFDRLFEVVTVEKLEVDGEPKLQQFDSRFIG